jgi:hypothetical protein
MVLQAQQNANQAGTVRNKACKLPICLSKNRHKKPFDGKSFALAAHVDGPDCKSCALELLVFVFCSAIKSEGLRFGLS